MKVVTGPLNVKLGGFFSNSIAQDGQVGDTFPVVEQGLAGLTLDEQRRAGDFIESVVFTVIERLTPAAAAFVQVKEAESPHEIGLLARVEPVQRIGVRVQGQQRGCSQPMTQGIFYASDI